jgi:hypothetical protein
MPAFTAVLVFMAFSFRSLCRSHVSLVLLFLLRSAAAAGNYRPYMILIPAFTLVLVFMVSSFRFHLFRCCLLQPADQTRANFPARESD